jgi:hypothetical protein
LGPLCWCQGEICWWREPTAWLKVRFIGLGTASGGGAAPASSPDCSSSAIRRESGVLPRQQRQPGAKSCMSHRGRTQAKRSVCPEACDRSLASPSSQVPEDRAAPSRPSASPALSPRHTADTTPDTTRTRPRGPRRKISFYAGRPTTRPAAACSKV